MKKQNQYFVARIRPTTSGGEIEASTMRIFVNLEDAEKYNEELQKPMTYVPGVQSILSTMFCELYPNMKPIGLNNVSKVRIG